MSAQAPGTPVILMSGQATIEMAVKATRLRARTEDIPVLRENE